MDSDPTDRVSTAPSVSEDSYAWTPVPRILVTAEQARAAGLPEVDIALEVAGIRHHELTLLLKQGVYVRLIDNAPGGGGWGFELRAARSDECGVDGLSRAAKAVAGERALTFERFWVAGASREYAWCRSDFSVPPGRDITQWLQIVRVDAGAATLYATLSSDNGIDRLDWLRVREPGWMPAPIGRVVARQFQLTGALTPLANDPQCGVFTARRIGGDADYLVTLKPRGAPPYPTFEATKSWNVESGMLPFELSCPDGDCEALVERAPTVEALRGRRHPRDTARAFGGLRRIVARAHQRGEAFGFLRPELAFGSPTECVTVRPELFAGPSVELFSESFAAPEVLAGGPPTPSADVYSMCAIVARWLTDRPVDRQRLRDRWPTSGFSGVLLNGLSERPEERLGLDDLAHEVETFAKLEG